MNAFSSLARHLLPILVLFFGFLVFFSYSSAAFAAIPIAQVVWVKGTIKAIAVDNKERDLKRSDFIYEHETLKTDANSTGQIVFTDSSLLSLREGTEFKVDQYKYSKDAPPSDNKFLGNLVKGGFRTVTGAISKDHPENYQVNTPVATIGVRGTQYSVYLNPNGGLELAIERGAINIQNSMGAVVLNANTGNIYATVQSKNIAPKNTTTPPPGLKAQPPLEPAKPSPELNKAAGVNEKSGAATGSVAGTTSGGSGSSGGSSSGASSGSSSSSDSSGTTGGSSSGSSPKSTPSGSGGGGGGCGNLTIGG